MRFRPLNCNVGLRMARDDTRFQSSGVTRPDLLPWKRFPLSSGTRAKIGACLPSCGTYALIGGLGLLFTLSPFTGAVSSLCVYTTGVFISFVFALKPPRAVKQATQTSCMFIL
jgi:hypothetical protein